ncbi:MAG: hypothetical protein UT30_C0008G0020 [Candidatus Uhrbacteria bacterium GW2011_GWF2_39_13]|uniref:NodB homology domain-containing protein n=1 Tax=Candidatus Uhrbacteria bacterium GW2011_GWF2_39_13 TaxID=1618995 RepID=A0A0G0MMQ5_9BACT|nr:MAG: hypothetical protein UT30_C0008G0020 [Candidatus Uhrbacteria bacterium GW2011_GWF2_39_13]
MKSFLFCFSTDDGCLDGYSTEAHLERLLAFCEEEKIKMTLFTVPLSFEKKSKTYSSILKNMISQGHEIGQHGLEHTRFEFGIPPEMILDLPHEKENKEFVRTHRPEIEKQLSVSVITSRLRNGREILEQNLNCKIKGFRGPCLSVCGNLFTALVLEKYAYDSSKCFQPGAWDILNNKKEIKIKPITKKDFDAAQVKGDMKTLPLTAEYTWYLEKDKLEITFDLARHDLDACIENDIPFVPVCHVSPIQEGNEPLLGFEFYRRLIAYGQEKAASMNKKFEAVTMSEACNKFFSKSQE